MMAAPEFDPGVMEICIDCPFQGWLESSDTEPGRGFCEIAVSAPYGVDMEPELCGRYAVVSS